MTNEELIQLGIELKIAGNIIAILTEALQIISDSGSEISIVASSALIKAEKEMNKSKLI